MADGFYCDKCKQPFKGTPALVLNAYLHGRLEGRK